MLGHRMIGKFAVGKGERRLVIAQTQNKEQHTFMFEYLGGCNVKCYHWLVEVSSPNQ